MEAMNIHKIKQLKLNDIWKKGKEKLNNEDNKFQGKQGTKINNIVKNYNTNNTIILQFIIKTLILIMLFCKIKSNIYVLNFFQDSKITLKIKGKKENIMFNKNFKGINSLKEIHIFD